MKYRKCRRRHPGRIGAGRRVRRLVQVHRLHQIRHGPHTLADLADTVNPGIDADFNIPVLVGVQPAHLLHLILGNRRSKTHHGVDFITGSIQKAGVDENHPIPGFANTLFQINGGSALFVHDPDLERVSLQSQNIFHSSKKLNSCGNFLWTVQLGFYHINAATPTVGKILCTFTGQVVYRTQTDDHCVQKTFRDFVSSFGKHRIGIHVHTNVAHQHHAPGRYDRQHPIRIGELHVRVQRPFDRSVSFLELRS